MGPLVMYQCGPWAIHRPDFGFLRCAGAALEPRTASKSKVQCLQDASRLVDSLCALSARRDLHGSKSWRQAAEENSWCVSGGSCHAALHWHVVCTEGSCGQMSQIRWHRASRACKGFAHGHGV